MLEKERNSHRFKESINSIAVVDAAIRTLKVMIAKDVVDNSSDSWAKAVPKAVWAYNSNSHSVLIGSAPEDAKAPLTCDTSLRSKAASMWPTTPTSPKRAALTSCELSEPSGSCCLAAP